MTRRWFAAFLLFGFLCAPSGPLAAAEEETRPFQDVAAERGLGEVRGQYVVWGDYNDDGHPDLLANGSVLYRNAGPPGYAFVPAGKKTGLPGKLRGRGLFVDVDNDGDLDLPTTGGQLWLNKGGVFEEADTWGWAPPERCSGMAWFDADGDGWLDVYFTVSEDWNKGRPKYYTHKLMRNDGGKGFRDVSSGQPFAQRRTYGRSVIACDHDLDGDPDLYVGNYRIQPNFFLRNDGSGRLTDVAASNGTAGTEKTYKDEASGRLIGPYFGHTIGAAWADFNNDGLFDLFVANLVHKYVGPTQNMGNDIRGHICDDSKIYLNRGGPDFRFEDVRTEWGVPLRPVGGRGVYKGDELWSNVVCGDFDNDGRIDAFVPQVYNLEYAFARLYRNRGGAGFVDVGEKAGVRVINTYGGAWADFDSDGSLDLASMGQDGVNPRGQDKGKQKKFRSRLHLYRNPGSDRSWIRFDLRAASGNRNAVGAQVFVRTADLLQVRQVEIGTGSHGQQNDARLHFGLGKAEAVTSVLIRWGRGLVQLLKPLPERNRTHALTEPPRPRFRIRKLSSRRTGPMTAEVKVVVTGSGRRAYLWDFDGDGRFEERSSGPATTRNFGSAGSHRVRVLVLDPKTATGLEGNLTVEAY
jgi:hypothetical protein